MNKLYHGPYTLLPKERSEQLDEGEQRFVSRGSESRRVLPHHIECRLQRHPRLTQCSFFKQTANQCDAVRYSPRRRKFWQWMIRVGRPIAARFRNMDKARSQGEGRVSREVGDGQHFVAERRHQ